MLSKETLLCMKYPELQKLAKSYGIKANAKVSLCIDLLYYRLCNNI